MISHPPRPRALPGYAAAGALGVVLGVAVGLACGPPGWERAVAAPGSAAASTAVSTLAPAPAAAASAPASAPGPASAAEVVPASAPASEAIPEAAAAHAPAPAAPLSLRALGCGPPRPPPVAAAVSPRSWPRPFDGGPVASPSQLAWKIRRLVVHASPGVSAAAAGRRAAEAGWGRHLYVGREGAVWQAVDLARSVSGFTPAMGFEPAKLPGLDDTSVHLQLGLDPGQRGLTPAQRGALGRVLAGLQAIAPRVRLAVPPPPPVWLDVRAWRGVVGAWRLEGRPAPVDVPWAQVFTAVRRDQPAGAARARGAGHPAGFGGLEVRGRRGAHVRVTGPGGFAARVRLPWAAGELLAGVYRVGVAREGLPPYKVAVRVDPGGEARVDLPDLEDPNLDAIVIAGEPYPLPAGVRVRTFRQPRGLSFYEAQRHVRHRTRLYTQRRRDDGAPAKTLEDVAKVVHLGVLHADVLPSPRTAFEVLVSGGLSTHFEVDADGTIFQLLDPVDVAFGAGEVNPYAVQIDLNNLLPNLVTRPKAPAYRPGGRRRGARRPVSRREAINGRDVQSYGYTDAQYRALGALTRVLSGVFPRLEPRVFRDPSGGVPWRYEDRAEDFRGYVAHWHLTPRRWDPGPGFDWARLDRALRGAGDGPQAGAGVSSRPGR